MAADRGDWPGLHHHALSALSSFRDCEQRQLMSARHAIVVVYSTGRQASATEQQGSDGIWKNAKIEKNMKTRKSRSVKFHWNL